MIPHCTKEGTSHTDSTVHISVYRAWQPYHHILQKWALTRTAEEIEKKAPSQRRTTFSFYILPKQSRVDNICKYQWGERCERNEALGRKKNHLIERTKYQSAIRNGRKLEIRKRSLTSKVVRS